MTELEERGAKRKPPPERMTHIQIAAVYESGAEAVIALVAHLQARIAALAFDKLLALLLPDREQAGHKYEEIRRALTHFFARRAITEPEVCADRVFEIVQQKIAEGVEIEDVRKYFWGIAKNVWLRQRECQHPLSELPEEPDRDKRLSLPAPQLVTQAEADEESYLKCKKACLQALPSDERELIVAYCRGRKRDKEGREELAKKLDITVNALTTRISRIRLKLNECKDKCLGRKRSPRV